jgi:hypothetical protein
MNAALLAAQSPTSEGFLCRAADTRTRPNQIAEALSPGNKINPHMDELPAAIPDTALFLSKLQALQAVSRPSSVVPSTGSRRQARDKQEKRTSRRTEE